MRWIAVIGVVLAMLLGACGSSSGPSEAAAGRLLEAENVSNAHCARLDGREFTCRGDVEGSRVVIYAVVAESEESIVVAECKDFGSLYKVCDGVR